MKLLYALLFLPALLQAADPRLVFTKSFPGSVPEYVEITVQKSGAVVYKEAPDDNNPISIQLAPGDSNAMFALADSLDHFAKPLESGLKVAFMGKKTFRYEDGCAARMPKQPHEAEFNYSA